MNGGDATSSAKRLADLKKAERQRQNLEGFKLARLIISNVVEELRQGEHFGATETREAVHRHTSKRLWGFLWRRDVQNEESDEGWTIQVSTAKQHELVLHRDGTFSAVYHNGTVRVGYAHQLANGELAAVYAGLVQRWPDVVETCTRAMRKHHAFLYLRHVLDITLSELNRR